MNWAMTKRQNLCWGLEGNNPASITPATTGKYVRYNFQMSWFSSDIFKAKFDGPSLYLPKLSLTVAIQEIKMT